VSVATSVWEEPIDERFLDLVLSDQELVDFAFACIVDKLRAPASNVADRRDSAEIRIVEIRIVLLPSGDRVGQHRQPPAWARSPPTAHEKTDLLCRMRSRNRKSDKARQRSSHDRKENSDGIRPRTFQSARGT
jgi:hypothetical protein